jgi:hypothetical protein
MAQTKYADGKMSYFDHLASQWSSSLNLIQIVSIWRQHLTGMAMEKERKSESSQEFTLKSIVGVEYHMFA